MSRSLLRPYMAILLTLFLVRLISLALYPLMDTTEARYGEMARIMVETGNWLTPMFDYNVPFWGKPPLHTWMSAMGIEIFGVSEFAVRFPHWLAAVLIAAMIFRFAEKIKVQPVSAVIIMVSTGVFYVSAGAVMTDMALTLGMTLAMVGFYLCWQDRASHIYGYVGFVGLAIGLLAKGPVALVLMALSIFPWLIWSYGLSKPWKMMWQRIPIFSGSLLMLAIALPWYVLAEHSTPGFVNYFIVGEHWLRFVESGWQGDLYGTAHDEPRGTIWMYFAINAMPWSILIPLALWRIHKSRTGLDAQAKFFLCWMLSPLLLFTFAGNVLPAYVLPSVPGMALLIAYAWQTSCPPKLKPVALSIPILLLVTVVIINLGPVKEKSDKWLLGQRAQNIPTYYWRDIDFSSRFYSRGKARVISEMSDVLPPDNGAFYLVVSIDDLDDFYQCTSVEKTNSKALLICAT